LILAFQSAYWTRFSCPAFISLFPPLKGIPASSLYQQTLWALLPMWLLVFFYLKFYRDVMLSAYDELVLVLKGVILCALLTTAMTFAYRGAEYSRLVIGLWATYSVLLVYSLRECDKFLFRKLTENAAGPRHVLVIGKGKAADLIRDLSAKQPFLRTSFMEGVTDTQAVDHYCETHHIAEVLLIQGSVPSETILETAKFCETHNLECKILPDLLEMRRGEIILDGFCGLPTFSIRSASLYGTDYYLKRSFDVIVSLLILIVLCIPLLIISLFIQIDSPGPAIFSQDRMGFLGKKFKLYKFRTMVIDADRRIDELKPMSDRPGPVFKMKNDPRITHFGKWLRRMSLDEIPQIFNVLKGDMSLVGPRPQVLWEAAHYDEHAKKRLRVKPGITGLWQVSGRAALSYEEMIDLDVFYLENWSLGLDLKILIRTLPAVFAKEGAY
jgi:exopolysaccharide biosynthesis polyprenyl glycosylphosphotransferase